MKYHVAVDAAGRLVIPKALRDLLGLQGASTLSVEVAQGRLVMAPVDAESSCLTLKDGALLIGGKLTGPVPTLEDVRRQRIEGFL